MTKRFGNFKKDFIDKRLVNLVKYHYLSLRLLRSLFMKFENKCKNNHEVQIKLSRVQTCGTDLASFFANAMTVLTSVIDISFRVQFKEFHRQIMDFPIESNHVPKFLATGDR